MYNSLNKLSKLPPDTKVYCGHEYTFSNLKFALSIDKDNAALIKKIGTINEKSCTIPGTIGEELEINPFMRTGHVNLWKQFGDDPITIMNNMREAKNKFR